MTALLRKLHGKQQILNEVSVQREKQKVQWRHVSTVNQKCSRYGTDLMRFLGTATNFDIGISITHQS